MKLLNKIKDELEKMGNKEYITKLIIILIIGVMILITVSMFTDSKNKGNYNLGETNTTDKSKRDSTEDYVTILERKLENILSQIKGAGEVNVMITLQNTTEKVPAVNTTKNQENTSEKDSQGGVRETLKEDTVYEIVTKENEDSFITLKEINPEVNGVIVVAQGADDAVVKEKLYEAVKTVLGISGSKVDVYSSN